MKKTSLIEMLNFVEENSNYSRLLRERNLDPADYEQKLALIVQAFGFLDLPAGPLDVFTNRKHMIKNARPRSGR
jgi:hypothetical protein